MTKNEFITRFTLRNISLSSTDTLNDDSYPSNPSIQTPSHAQLKPAAVLILLSPCAITSELTITLTKRAQHLRHHAGQIAFPGGKFEQNDTSLIATALRETEEEIGIPAKHVNVLGCLPRQLTVSGFIVTPVVGLLKSHCNKRYSIDKNEVAEIIEVPLNHFIRQHNSLKASSLTLDTYHQGKKRNVHVMPYQHHMIWGATAAMLHALIKHI